MSGLQQLRQLLTSEALLNFSMDGRPSPWLAEHWATTADGLTVRIKLRSNVRFHDGSQVGTADIAQFLRSSLPATMGSMFEDILEIGSAGDTELLIRLRRPSPLVLEALQHQAIRGPANGAVGTGPFIEVDGTENEIRANDSYYLGAPRIARVSLNAYPSIRAAWADLLRYRLDMLFEVGSDGISALEGSKQVALHRYTRGYQFALALNPNAPALRSPSVRRALNMAIDRAAIIREAFDGRAEISLGPVSPHHWALGRENAGVPYDPRSALEQLRSTPGGRTLRFSCLVPPDTERIALSLKRQLQGVGVEMDVHEVPPDAFLRALRTSQFDAALTEFLSGPTLFDVYGVWHSRGPLVGGLGGPLLDAALDRVRHAANDDEYRAGVAEVQHAALEDPPAIFLAWGQRARAVSRRFEIPAEPNSDILATLRLWRPVGQLAAGRGTN